MTLATGYIERICPACKCVFYTIGNQTFCCDACEEKGEKELAK